MKRFVSTLLLLAAGCSEVQLAPVPKPVPVLDDRLSVSGSFCTDPPQPAQFPVRVLFIVDVSQSMNITDPAPPACNMMACFTRRGQAVLDVLSSNPAGNGVEYALISFQSSSSVLTHDAQGNDGFTDKADEVKTKLPLLNLGNGETNYEGALANAYQLLQTDMIKLGATERSRARYIVIFLSDGMPAPVSDNFNTPARIANRVAAIKKLETDERLAEVTFHAAYLAGPDTPLQVQLPAKNLLDDMARRGGGTFRTFQADEKIRFFYIDFSAFIRSFALKSFIVSDENSHPRDGKSSVDSDGDGLLDDEEVVYGTDPRNPDTDGDGFNDLLEVRLRDSGFDPLYPGDADCALASDRLDDDGDGLRNCEERFIGTDQHLFDSDGDGMADDLEFRMGSNPVVNDALADPDFDGARNQLEIPAHTDPERDDVAQFSKIAYRYQVQIRPANPMQPGQQCFDFSVENLTLTPTLDVHGMQQGTNTVLLRVITAPLDSPEDFGDARVACVRPRYRRDPEEKEPPSGHMTVGLDRFKRPGAPPAPLSSPLSSGRPDGGTPDGGAESPNPPSADDPQVFRADRDCVSP